MGYFQVSPGLRFKTRVGALMQIKLIFTRKVVHLASFWEWGFLELGSGLLGISAAPEIEPTTSRSAVKRSPTELLRPRLSPTTCKCLSFQLFFFPQCKNSLELLTPQSSLPYMSLHLEIQLVTPGATCKRPISSPPKYYKNLLTQLFHESCIILIICNL